MTNQKKIIEFEIVRTRTGSVSFKQEQGKVNVYLDGELSSIGDYLMNEDDREDISFPFMTIEALGKEPVVFIMRINSRIKFSYFGYLSRLFSHF